MRYRTLGRTGLSVSEISLGTVEIGMDYGIRPERPLEKDAARLLDRALDLGINLIDTARAYGESEAVIGRALHGRRREFILVTKVLASADIVESVETSLRELRTDAVDVLMIHSAPMQVVQDGAVTGALLELKQKGWCRYIGASVYGNEAALAAIRIGKLDCLQIAYSMLDRRPECGLIAEAQTCGIGLVARSVLLKGALTHRSRWLPPGLDELKQSVQALGRLGNLPELAYRYVLSRDIPQTALVGTGSLCELEEVVAFAEQGPLPAEIIERIRGLPMPPEFQLNPANWPC
jgi:aryl-alcohol dehydrogenase-like predicted oxidoreductase